MTLNVMVVEFVQKICPVNNIEIINRHPEWQHHCENCYACFLWCPNEAIHGDIISYNDRRHHPKVTLSDMINQEYVGVGCVHAPNPTVMSQKQKQ